MFVKPKPQIMFIGHTVYLVCYVCCMAHAASLEGFESAAKNKLADTNYTKDSLTEWHSTQSNPKVPSTDHTEDNLTMDSRKVDGSDVMENGTSVNFDNRAANISETVNATEDQGIPYTERSGNSLTKTRYKTNRVHVSMTGLEISGSGARHLAMVHKNDKPDAGENLVKKRRRIPSSSATPSIQIVILVVGAVVGCLLLTGFVRWRFRGRLNAKKNAKMVDDFLYEGGRMYKRNSEMSTIYECEFEEGQSMLRLGDTLDMDMEDFQEGSGTKFGDISSSHRFDKPLALMSRVYSSKHSGRLLQPRSPKSGRKLRLVPGSKRNSMNRHKYGHKNRYSKHLKKRLENMFVQTLETIPMETSALTNEHSGSSSSLALFSEHGHPLGLKELSNEHLAMGSSQPAAALKHGSPTFRRGAFASLLNTWRSLSYNRDWVGKIWQEQHNIRRLSDILRGRRATSCENSRRGSLNSNTSSTRSTDAKPGWLSSSTESVSSVSSFGSLFAFRRNSRTDRHDGRLFPILDTSDAAAGEQNDSHLLVMDNETVTEALLETEVAGNNHGSAAINVDNLVAATDCREAPTDEKNTNYWSHRGLHDDPAAYESLLGHRIHARKEVARQFDEHPRFQKVYKRKRLETRRRSNSFNGDIYDSVNYKHAGSYQFLSRNKDNHTFRNSSGLLACASYELSETCVPNVATSHLNANQEHERVMDQLSGVTDPLHSVLVSPLVQSSSMSVPGKQRLVGQLSEGTGLGLAPPAYPSA